MTPAEYAGRGGPESLETAARDLDRVRDLLLAAGRGQAGAEEVKASVTGYLDLHGPAQREAARSVGENLRVQLLAELYRWRAQLDAQLKGAGPGTTPRGER